MTKVVVILAIDGAYESAHADSELEFEVLQRGKDDAKIDVVEANMSELTPE